MQTSTIDRPRPLNDAASREHSRLAALHAYEALDSAADARIDELTRAAAELFGVPVASVSLLDRDRLWAKSLVGTDVRQVPRTDGFSSRLLDIEATTLVILDATLDAELCDLKLVKGPEAFRFYAGAKLLDADGHMLGVLCALDRRPRSATPAQLRQLESLAAAVVTALDLNRSETALQRSSVRDTVTGLANRSSFEAALRDTLGQRVAGRCAVLAVDLGRFSRVIDLAGHAGGEDLLRQAADRLKAIAGSHDLVARLAGDEYAVLVPGSDGDEAKALGDEILDSLAEPFDIGGVPIQLNPSVGVACYPEDGACAADLLRHVADAAYWAKRRGRNRSVRFEARLHKERVGRQLMERDLRLAVANGGFELEWRPTACVATGRLVGFDALIRWDRPGHGAVAADLLVTTAESAGLASALDRWLLDAACRAAAHWQVPLRVCVRMLGPSFQQPDFPAVVARALRECALPAKRLQIEVGAQSFVDPAPDMARRVEQVRSLGVEVVINDFGSGVVAVAELLDVKFDVIKLGSEMVRAAARGGRSEAVAAGVIQLAKSLGERVCATGVQGGAECAFLLEHGCDEVQGKVLDRLAPTTLDPMQEWDRVASPDRLASEDPRAAIRGIAAAVVVSSLLWAGLHQLFTLVA